MVPTDEELAAFNLTELLDETVLEPQNPTQSCPYVHGDEFESMKKEVANVDKEFKDMKEHMDHSILNLLNDIKSILGRQTEIPEAKGSDIVEEVAEETKKSNEQDDLQHNVHVGCSEQAGDIDVGGKDGGEQCVVDAAVLKNGSNASILIGEQVRDGQVSDKDLADDAPISERSLDDLVSGMDFLGDLGNSATKGPTLDDFELPPFNESEIIAIETNFSDIVTPEQQARNRNPGKYGKSPYVVLNSAGSSIEKSVTFFQIKYSFANCLGFDIDLELLNEFLYWVYVNISSRRGRKAAYTLTANKINNPFDLGVERVDKMEWFHTMVHTEKSWEDSNVHTYTIFTNIIHFSYMVDLEMAMDIKMKYQSESPVLVTSEEIESVIRRPVVNDITEEKMEDMKEKSRIPMLEGGSSYHFLNSLIKDFKDHF